MLNIRRMFFTVQNFQSELGEVSSHPALSSAEERHLPEAVITTGLPRVA